MDSLGLLKVVAWLEDEFDIGVDDLELGPDSFRTVAAIKAYVDQARSTANAEEDPLGGTGGAGHPALSDRRGGVGRFRGPPRC